MTDADALSASIRTASLMLLSAELILRDLPGLLELLASADWRASGALSRAGRAMISSPPTPTPVPENMLPAIISYAIYLIAAAIMLGVFFFIYTRITPFDEVALIHARNGAAALSLGGALIGFSLTIASGIIHNTSFIAFVLWSVGAMIVQVIVYAIASRILHTVRTEIEAGNLAMGGFMGTISLVAGVINAACLS